MAPVTHSLEEKSSPGRHQTDNNKGYYEKRGSLSGPLFYSIARLARRLGSNRLATRMSDAQGQFQGLFIVQPRIYC